MSHVKKSAYPIFQASIRFAVAMLLLLCSCEVSADDNAGAENRQKEMVQKKAAGETVSSGQTRQSGLRDTHRRHPHSKDGLSSSADSDSPPVQQRSEYSPEDNSPAPVNRDPTKIQPEFKSPPEDNSPAPVNRDPTRIRQEFESQMEEAKPPKIRVTGVVESKGRKYAVAELDLEDFKGMVMLKPGMTVSIPKPKKGKSESKNWMTYFKVTDITQSVVFLEMENGEKITVPVMGEKYDRSTK